MEIDVTHLVKMADEMCAYSASRMELGDKAGEITWENAKSAAEETPLVRPEQLGNLQDYFREFGAWDDDELEAMTAIELNALLLQMVASEIREREHYSTVKEWKKAQESGQCSGNLYQSGKRWYYYVVC